MSYLRRFVVVLLLAVWSFPAIGLARSESQGKQAPSGRAISVESNGRSTATATRSETEQYSQREKQAQDLEQFTAGSAIYIGGGAVTVLLLVLLIVLLV